MLNCNNEYIDGRDLIELLPSLLNTNFSIKNICLNVLHYIILKEKGK